MNQRGLSLIEVLLITVLIALVVGSLIQLGIRSLHTADEGRTEGVAMELTKEAIEIARSKRDEDSTDFFAQIEEDGNGYYRLLGGNVFEFVGAVEPLPPNLSLYEVTGYSGYYRVISFTLDGTGTNLKMWVRTYWRTSTGRYDSIVLETIFTKWR